MAYPVYEDNGGIGTGTGTSVDVPYPSTVNVDDVLICATMDTDNDTFNTPTGWNKTIEFSDVNLSVAYYWKRAAGTEGGTVETFTSTSSSGNLVAGIMARFSGCKNTGNPFDAHSTYGITGSGTNVNIPSITTLGTQRLIYSIVVIEDNVTCSTSSPNSWSEAFHLTTTVGDDAAFKGQTIQVATASTVSGDTSILGGSTYHSVQCIALIPAYWPHNYLGVANASIGKINGVSKADIQSVNSVT